MCEVLNLTSCLIYCEQIINSDAVIHGASIRVDDQHSRRSGESERHPTALVHLIAGDLVASMRKVEGIKRSVTIPMLVAL